ncbi:MAG: nucleotidyltransferase family protein [Candidatus Accumulibacter sp.]|uniref:nucleotidyltransferase domain-containing protein n=1 Tax=Accumulibacter sp. TaxID=2053492 RepID=UPI0019EFD098|nr:nucleotidyltransferase family protein [Accumulibacter sp.]MBE2259247.1 nucleotidyltransferase family protein [Paracoccaceae bacterium]MCP5249800.1 nucleotidyltransferase family protein [Accumulibacter sp.]
MISLGPADPCLHSLLGLLIDPGGARTMSLAQWDKTIRLARQARLLGVLAHRIQSRAGLLADVPECVLGHLYSATAYSAHRSQLLRIELTALADVLPAELPVVLLKGAAYLVQDLEVARGRLPGDVDLMVARNDLDRAEAALLGAGWEAEEIDAYGERYYREWSHELPPMRFPGHAVEVDLHHTITPVTGRLKPDTARLFADLQAVPGERFLVLHPLDQILHAAVHLFQDSDLSAQLRDLVDIDALIRAHVRSDEDWQELAARATRHQFDRPLWYVLRYCHAWLGTALPEDLPLIAPSASAVRLLDWIFPRCTLPRIPDQPPGFSRRIAARLALIRQQWLRLPPSLLLRHLGHKTWQSLRPRPAVQHKAG